MTGPLTASALEVPRPCPQCSAPSPYEPPETFQSGLLDGIVPVEPDSWICPEHGRWTDQTPDPQPEETL